MEGRGRSHRGGEERAGLLVEPVPALSPGRVALLAGSFDPMTLAHAALVEAAAALADLVVLVYSTGAMPKDPAAGPPLLTEARRLASLRAYATGREGVSVGLTGLGLLADQAAAASARFPRSELLLVMGSDKVLQLLDPSWYPDRDRALDELFSRSSVRYALRRGEEEAVREALAAAPAWRDRFERLAVPVEVASTSSREVRRRRRRGEPVGHLVPAEVAPFLP